jgi:hypothetical protein
MFIGECDKKFKNYFNTNYCIYTIKRRITPGVVKFLLLLNLFLLFFATYLRSFLLIISIDNPFLLKFLFFCFKKKKKLTIENNLIFHFIENIRLNIAKRLRVVTILFVPKKVFYKSKKVNLSKIGLLMQVINKTRDSQVLSNFLISIILKIKNQKGPF